jgi:hypothetical protein
MRYQVKSTKEIKQALKKEFKHDFSVTQGRGTAHHWVNVRWYDGPPEEIVRSFCGQFNDSGRDDYMTDLWCGCQYTTESRNISAGPFIKVMTEVCKRYEIPIPTYKTELSWDKKIYRVQILNDYCVNNYKPGWHRDGANYISGLIYQEIYKTDFTGQETTFAEKEKKPKKEKKDRGINPDWPEIIGYKVEKNPEDNGNGGQVAYLLHGKNSATYGLRRSMKKPEFMYVINLRKHGTVTKARGYSWFTDKNGQLTTHY